MLLPKTLTLALFMFATVGCASRDGGRGRENNPSFDASTADASLGEDSSIEQTELEGAYAIRTWTVNTSGCGFEGPSALDAQGDRFAFVRHQALFGEALVTAGTCLTRAECEEEAFVGDNEVRISGLTFERGSDTAGWEGDFIATSWSGDLPCNGTVKTSRMTWDGSTLTIRTEERSVTFAQTGISEDECPVDMAKQVAQNVPCESLEVITAAPL